MSQSFNHRKKELRKSASAETKRIRRMIRLGQLPRLTFEKSPNGSPVLNAVVKAGHRAGKRIKWLAVSTAGLLLRDEGWNQSGKGRKS